MKETEEKMEAGRPVAVITGGSRGIGRAIAVELSRHGFDIAAIDTYWGNDGPAAEIEANGVRFLPVDGDIAAVDRHPEFVETVMGTTGRIDLLVNNAGVAPLERTDLLEMKPGSYDRVMSINLRGPFFLTQTIARKMLQAREVHPGRRMSIVFITSISATVSSVTRGEYCVSKAGLSMAARLYADRLAAARIGVFEIRPGIILTQMTAPVKEKYDRMIAEGLIPQGRWGLPEDVAGAVAAIADGAFAYSTGAVIEVSGGMNIPRL